MAEQKTAVVAGGTGGIGEGIVRVLLSEGYRVFVPIREIDKSDRLLSYVSDLEKADLRLVPGDLGDLGSVLSCLEAVLRVSPGIDLVVASVGSYYYGYSLHKLPRADWDKLLHENLLTHFHLQRVFLNRLHEQNGGVYLTLTGPESGFVHPETGLMSVVSAAQKMMAQVAAMEAAGSGVKVYSLTAKTPVASRSRGGQVAEEWISAEDLGRYIYLLAEGRLPTVNNPVHEIESRQAVRKLF